MITRRTVLKLISSIPVFGILAKASVPSCLDVPMSEGDFNEELNRHAKERGLFSREMDTQKYGAPTSRDGHAQASVVYSILEECWTVYLIVLFGHNGVVWGSTFKKSFATEKEAKSNMTKRTVFEFVDKAVAEKREMIHAER